MNRANEIAFPDKGTTCYPVKCLKRGFRRLATRQAAETKLYWAPEDSLIGRVCKSIFCRG